MPAVGQRTVIGVIGGRKTEKTLLMEAEKVGRLIAGRGGIVVCGGLKGVMEAASRGARSAGGLTIGILPQDDKREANEFIDIAIPTGLGVGRNVIVARTAEALIAVGGEYGTLSEIAFALQMKKTVVGIGSWQIKGVIQAESAEEAVEKAFQGLMSQTGG